MTPGVRALSGTQLGKESTSGTSVAATARWRGPVLFPVDDRVMNLPKEDVAIVGGTIRSNVSALQAKLALPETEATYEQLGYIFNMGIKGVAGSQDGAGTDYIYTHAFATTAANTPYSYTFEGFDNTQEYESEYVVAESFKLSGAGKEAVKVSASLFGRQVTTSTKTGALSLVSVTDILFQTGKLYIDAIGGTIGTTQKTGTWLGFDLDITTGFKPKFTGDGNLYFTTVYQDNYEIKGKITLEHDSNATAQFANYQAQTPVLMQMKFVGTTAFATPGTTYTYPTLILNMPILWTKWPAVTEADGNNRIEAEFISRYSLTSASAASFIIVNELTALA